VIRFVGVEFLTVFDCPVACWAPPRHTIMDIIIIRTNLTLFILSPGGPQFERVQLTTAVTHSAATP
jgi:hypothetical protein